MKSSMTECEVLEERFKSLRNTSSHKPNAVVVADCIDARHPTLKGRVRCRWTDGTGKRHDRWVATLMGLVVRVGDRVLMQAPSNWSEVIVVGVVDGFEEHREEARSAASTIELKRDETVRVVAEDGTGLVEPHQSETGPVVRLLCADSDVRMKGKLRLEADAIELKATRGPVQVEASDDVVVKGEIIHLN